jgi:hypothetical protein
MVKCCAKLYQLQGAADVLNSDKAAIGADEAEKAR